MTRFIMFFIAIELLLVGCSQDKTIGITIKIRL